VRADDVLFWLLRALDRIESYRKLHDHSLRRQAMMQARHHLKEYARRMSIRLAFADLREVAA